MKVENCLDVYADHERSSYLGTAPMLHVVNDTDSDFVWIVPPNGGKYKVLARELQAAITNASNCAKY